MLSEASGVARTVQKLSTLCSAATHILELQKPGAYSMNRPFKNKRDKTSLIIMPEALVKEYVAYNAKFLGITEVDQPKGTDVVRVAVRKLKFQRHIKKAEGHKAPRVELQVSIYGVRILDPKTKEVLHNCQLHRMSFCADDKTDKRIFTFICTHPETKKHLCYVFDSEKCAEEITLAIGQAFDLAYKKFLESGGKDVETRKQLGNLQKRIQDLEAENSKLKKQLQELEDQLMNTHSSPLLHLTSSNKAFMLQRPSALFWCSSSSGSITTVSDASGSISIGSVASSGIGSAASASGSDLASFSCLEISSVTLTPASSPDSSLSTGLLTPPPSKPAQSKPVLDDHSLPRPRAGSIPLRRRPTDVFDMVPFLPVSPIMTIPVNGLYDTPPPSAPPQPTPPTHLPLKERRIDLFGAEPFDPYSYGLLDWSPDIQSKLDEMQEGFKMGLTLEGTVFSLDLLDSRC
ncbi:PTB domain-containing engulfment adapter protein 1 isoform X1 [Engraulis encrasicolus]|uniref:PTB domain-containing engulfment adapter protein 1 isoform X1 n=1 Tax=Engraulis encrasicolus TaxID=184585 RepID=UPI002FCEA24B